ncbi:MAG: hypothetical protein QW620_07435 [Thermoplasmata archaeon]
MTTIEELMAKEKITPVELKEAMTLCLTAVMNGDRTQAENTIRTLAKDVGVDWDKETLNREKSMTIMHRLRPLGMRSRDPRLFQENFQKMMMFINKCNW